jgi:hypothetical protein
MIKNIAELILALNKEDYKQTLIDIKNMSNYIASEWAEENRMKLLDSGLTKLIKRVTYKECLDMFDIETNLEVDEATFEDLLYGWDNEKDEYTQNEEYWSYNYVEDFEAVIKEHLDLDENLCTLVMLPNSYLQEIPHEYAYKLGGNE